MRLKDLTPQWLLETHFFGIYKTDTVTGEIYLENPADPTQRMPEHVIQRAIDESVSRLELQLNVSIRHREEIVERHDYDADTYQDYFTLRTRTYPVLSVDSLKVTYGENGNNIWEVPSDLIQTHGIGSKFGMIQVLPMWGTTNYYDPAYAVLFPAIYGSRHSPSMIELTYDAGMDGITKDGSDVHLDDILVRAIGLLAAIHPFNILGDIVIGAGIASVSTSIDGISQSITTTSSAENSAFSSRIIMHRNELFGEKGVPGVMHTLEKAWRMPSFTLL
jgi:hypothetical protein